MKKLSVGLARLVALVCILEVARTCTSTVEGLPLPGAGAIKLVVADLLKLFPAATETGPGGRGLFPNRRDHPGLQGIEEGPPEADHADAKALDLSTKCVDRIQLAVRLFIGALDRHRDSGVGDFFGDRRGPDPGVFVDRIGLLLVSDDLQRRPLVFRIASHQGSG